MLPDSIDLPVEISNDETIVRSLMTPWHVKKGKIKWQAFKPPVGEGLSVIRLRVGADYCKRKAVEIAAKNTNNAYIGLLSILAGSIRSCGSEIVDSRDPPNFFGHADIIHGLSASLPDEPALTPEENDALKARCEALVAAAILHCDPDPTADKWTGNTLKMAGE